MPKVVDRDQRRLDFIEAACATMLEDGLENTTVRAIAKRAGYTTGALVHYFADKEELIQLALQQFGSDVRQRMVVAEQRLRGRAALRQVLIEAMPKDRKSISSWKIWLAMWYHSEQSGSMRKEELRRYREWFERVALLLRESVADKELPKSTNIEVEARSIVALLDGLGVQFLMSRRKLNEAEMVNILDNYLKRLFRS